MEKALKKYFALFALPTLICFLIAFILPFLMGIYLSFCEFTTVTDAVWVGFKNFQRMFSNSEFMNSFWFTVKFAVLTVVLINVCAFGLALLLTRGIKGTNVFRTVFFMPNLIGGIVLGYIWLLIINGVLRPYGVDILADPNYGFWGLVVLTCWQNIGYMMVIYIAGIQGIDSSLIEAAEIDGAGRGNILRHIIIPSIMPSLTICTFMTLTNGFKLFDQNLALTAGGPNKQTEMLALNIYNTFYSRPGWQGVGQAKALLFSIIVALIALTQLRLSRSKEVES